MRSYLVLVLVLVLFALPYAGLADEQKHNGYGGGITVVGTGEVTATPDTVEFSVGASTEDSLASRALQANNLIVSDLLEVLWSFQIAKSDVQTERFDVAPQYEPVHGNTHARVLTGYHVNHLFRVKLRTPDQLGQLLNRLIGPGSNVLHGIRFSVGSSVTLIDQARNLAVADTHRKATQLASAGSHGFARDVSGPGSSG